MEIISLKCPQCMAKLEVNEKLKTATCNYCGYEFVIKDAVSSSFNEGYENEKGRIKAQEENRAEEVKQQEDTMLDYGRVEAVDDKALNSTLFDLYGKLVNPVHSYETLCTEIQTEQQFLITLKKKLIPPVFTLIHAFVIVFIVQVVLWFILAVAGVIPDDAGIDIDSNGNLIVKEEFKSYNNNNPILHVLMPQSVLEDMLQLSEPPGVVFILKQYLMLTLRDLLVVYAILWLIALYRYLTLTPKTRLTISEKEKKKEEIIESIKELIKYVPPAYRTSDALGFFYDSYKNSRVDNVKEAVRAYDEQSRHIAIMGGLDRIEQSVISVAAELSSLNEKMDSLKWDIQYH